MNYKWFAISIAIIAAIGAGVSALSGIAFWWAFLLVAGAIAINGFIATFEDDSPGGFNNPDGTKTPRYVIITRRIVAIFGAVLALLIIATLITLVDS